MNDAAPARIRIGSRILVASADDTLVSRIRPLLERESYTIERALTGEQALNRASGEPFDCLVIDFSVPAFEVCRQLRAAGEIVPVLVLAAAHRRAECVLALRLGADDFVVDPTAGATSEAEFLARVEAVIRRVRRLPADRAYASPTMEVDFLTAEVKCHERVVRLSALELKVLRYFIDHRGEVVSRDQLLNSVWGYDASPVTRTVDVRIASLRRKLSSSDAPAIVTIHGLGYKFVA